MNCKQVRAVLPELVSGELDSATHSRAVDHIKACAECRSEMLKCEAALGALASAWTPVAAPAALDSLSFAGTRRVGFAFGKMGLAGVCLAVVVAALIVLPRIHQPSERQAMAPVQVETEHRQPSFEPPKPQPEAKPTPNAEPKDTARPQPPAQIEKQEPRWDERRFRPHKQSDYVAQIGHKPVHPKIAKQAPKRQSSADEPKRVARAMEEPKPNDRPMTHKVTRPVVTYDSYGNKQVTLTETEEQTKPSEMALY